jgi:hypothetical protein
MRLFGYEVRRRGERGGAGRASFVRKTARAVLPAPLGHYARGWHAGRDRRAELEVYREIRRLMPIVDVAIFRLTRLVGNVRIEAPPEAIAEIEGFLRHVPVNGLQRGLQSFLANHVGQLLQYGYAAGEIVPDSGRRGVRALVNLDSRWVQVGEGESPLARWIGYQPPGTREPVRIPDSLALYSLHGAEGDSPYGTSILRSMPFVARAILTMETALQQSWERMGAPSFQVSWKPPEGFIDPDGSRTRQVLEDLEAGFTEAMQARHDKGLVSDFFASGDVQVRVIGSDGRELEFRETYRALTEQIVARTGLPPFMLGLSWSSTERMSTQQADLLISEVRSFRHELEPMIEKIIDLWQALTGRAGRYRVRWSEVSLQDLKDTAEAMHRRAMARSTDVQALGAMVDRGWIDRDYALEQLFPSARYEAMDEPAEPVDMPSAVRGDG